MPLIHYPKSFVVWFAMVGSEVTWATHGLSRSLHCNPQHSWGLPNKVDEFTPEEVANNTKK